MKRVIEIILRIGLGGLFVFAGVMKLGDPAAFLRDVQNYRLLPYAAAVAFQLRLSAAKRARSSRPRGVG